MAQKICKGKPRDLDLKFPDSYNSFKDGPETNGEVF